MNIRFAVMAAGSLFVASTAYAEPQTEAADVPKTQHQEEVTREVQSERFGMLDEDGDGAISQQEGQADTTLVKNWQAYDLDHDQKLNVEEFAAFEATRAASEGRTEAGMPSTKHQEKALSDEHLEKSDKHEGDH